jgi:hypothetical protein
MYMASERCGAALARAFLLVIPEGARATYASLTGALEAVKVHCEVREAELEAGVSVAAENKVRMTVALTPPWPTFGAAAGLQG